MPTKESNGRAKLPTGPLSNEEACKLFEAVVEQGDADALNNLGEMYIEGRAGLQRGREADKKACELFRAAAIQDNDRDGTTRAQLNLGMMYELARTGLPKGKKADKEACKWYRIAAEKGNASGQFNLGGMFIQGRAGLPKGSIEAEIAAYKWYRDAAEQGDIYALQALSMIGEERTASIIKAMLKQKPMTLPERADQGNTEAQFELSRQYFSLAEQDKQEQGLRYLQLAADGGHTEAQYTLGMRYADSDIQQTERYLKKVADQHHEAAALALSEIHIKKNTPQSWIQAEPFLKIAAKSRELSISERALTLLANHYHTAYFKYPTYETYQQALKGWKAVKKLNPTLANTNTETIEKDWAVRQATLPTPIDSQTQHAWAVFSQAWGSILLMKTLFAFIKVSNYEKSLKKLKRDHRDDQPTLDRLNTLESHFKILIQDESQWLDNLYNPSGRLYKLTHERLDSQKVALNRSDSLSYMRDTILEPLLRKETLDDITFLTQKKLLDAINNISQGVTPERLHTLIGSSHSPSTRLSAYLVRHLITYHCGAIPVSTHQDITHLAQLYYKLIDKDDTDTADIIKARINQYATDIFQSLPPLNGIELPGFFSSQEKRRQYILFKDQLKEMLTSLLTAVHQMAQDDLEHTLIEALFISLEPLYSKVMINTLISELQIMTEIPRNLSFTS